MKSLDYVGNQCSDLGRCSRSRQINSPSVIGEDVGIFNVGG